MFRLEEEDVEEKEHNKDIIRKLRHGQTPLEKEIALKAAKEGMAEMRIKSPEERNEFVRINNKQKMRTYRQQRTEKEKVEHFIGVVMHNRT